MTEVKMLRTFYIARDGINVEAWHADSVQSVSDAELQILIGEGACEIVENKAMQAAPENKSGKRGRPRKNAL